MQQTSMFLLATLAERGPMHGHQLRLQAAEDHAQEWALVSPGAIYGSISRLEKQGLVVMVRTEQNGARPPRQVYDITPEGRGALATMVHDALLEVVETADPFDLALAHAADWSDTDLMSVATSRLSVLEGRLTQLGVHLAAAGQWLSPRERWVVDHQRSRLASEAEWHRRLLSQLEGHDSSSSSPAQPAVELPR